MPVCLSQPRLSARWLPAAGRPPEMCGLRTCPWMDVDPPRVELPLVGDKLSRRPGVITCRTHKARQKQTRQEHKMKMALHCISGLCLQTVSKHRNIHADKIHWSKLLRCNDYQFIMWTFCQFWKVLASIILCYCTPNACTHICFVCGPLPAPHIQPSGWPHARYKCFYCSVLYWISTSALTLLVGQQEGHPACKNWVVGCWRGYLSAARCGLAYGPAADATATHCLLLH